MLQKHIKKETYSLRKRYEGILYCLKLGYNTHGYKKRKNWGDKDTVVK